MTDYRTEALRVYNSTRSADTRGIIAAFLHLADTLAVTDTVAPASTVPAQPVAGRSVWQQAAVTYLSDKGDRFKSAYRIREWLARQGMEVDEEDVTRGLWELVNDGALRASTYSTPVTFAAAKQ